MHSDADAYDFTSLSRISIADKMYQVGDIIGNTGTIVIAGTGHNFCRESGKLLKVVFQSARR